MGDKRLPGIASEDIGKCAYSIFKQGSEMIGKKIYIAGEHVSGSQMAASFSKALGREVLYNAVDPDVFRSFEFQGADEMGNMYQFKRDFNDYYCGIRDLNYVHRLNPDLQTFDQWLTKNAAKIPVE